MNRNFYDTKSIPIHIKIAFLLVCLVEYCSCINVKITFKNELAADLKTEYLDFELDKLFPISSNGSKKAIFSVIQPEPLSFYSAGSASWSETGNKETIHQGNTVSDQQCAKILDEHVASANKFMEYRENEPVELDIGKKLQLPSTPDVEVVSSSEILSRDGLFEITSTSISENINILNPVNENIWQTEKNLSVEQEILNAVCFDYSDIFIIRLDYFDKLIDSGKTEIKVDIEDITKEVVDNEMFRLFLRTCRHALDPKRIGLKNESVLCFVRLMQDICCYSTSNIMNKLYGYLLPLLLSQKYRISSIFNEEMSDIDILNCKKLLIPFINTIFDFIDIFFDAKKEELVFLKVNEPNKSDFFDFSYLKEIKFRISTDVYSILYHNDFKYKIMSIFWLLWLYTIKGIKISTNNTYFTEMQDSDYACECLLRKSLNSDIQRQKSGTFNIFVTNHINLDVKTIELDNIVLSVMDVSYLKKCVNLELLILVRCILPFSSTLLDEITVCFPQLKELRIICFSLSHIFFESIKKTSIEVLDLSCCEYIDIGEGLELEDSLNTLANLKLDFSKLNHQIFLFFMKSKNLRSLSARWVDFEVFKDVRDFIGFQKKFDFLDISGCEFSESYLRFFSTDLLVKTLIMQNSKYFEAEKKILSCPSLQMSVEILDLSCNIIKSDMLTHIQQFHCVSSLNLSESLWWLLNNKNDIYLFENSLKKLNISRNSIGKSFMNILNRFTTLEELIASECNFDVSFIIYIDSVEGLKKSLKKIDITKIKVELADITGLRMFENLENLSITLDSKVVLNYIEGNHGIICENIKSLTLSFTVIDEIIFKFIMLHSNLVVLDFDNCEIKIGLFPRELRNKLIRLHSINLLDTNVSSDDLQTLKHFRRNGISVVLNY